jgi:hypothetical protein
VKSSIDYLYKNYTNLSDDARIGEPGHKLHILILDGDTLGVDGAHVGPLALLV